MSPPRGGLKIADLQYVKMKKRWLVTCLQYLSMTDKVEGVEAGGSQGDPQFFFERDFQETSLDKGWHLKEPGTNSKWL